MVSGPDNFVGSAEVVSGSGSQGFKSSSNISGHILISYAYDVGDQIDINKIRLKNILKVNDKEPFPHFKNYHIPVSVDVADFFEREESVALSVKIHSFGVISLNYVIPFSETFETLKIRLIDVVELYKQISKSDAREVFREIRPVVHDSNFFNLKTSYYAVQVDNKVLKVGGRQIIDDYGHAIAALLRLETAKMSDFQVEEILQKSTAYYGSDLIIINAEGAFIYDSEYLEPLEFFELAGIQKLELQCFDKLMDKKLNYFYNTETYRLPLRSYIPLLGSRLDSLLLDMAKLRVDISVITERLNNSVNMSGDSYFQKVYNMLVSAFRIREWKDSVDEKLSITNEMYLVRKNRLDTIREEVQTLAIILLITCELVFAILK